MIINIIKTGLFAVFALLIALPVQAASITWTTDATTITSTTDIDLTGTLVNAGNWGSGSQSVVLSETINFVDRTINGSGNPADVTASGETSQTGFFAGDTGDAAFNNVLDSFAYDGANPKVLTLNGLTNGNQYQIQLLTSDDRGTEGGRTQLWSDSNSWATRPNAPFPGNSTSVFTHNSSSYVIGQFTADSTSQTIYGWGVAQNQNIINGYVLRAIPEPATLALLGLGGFGILTRRRRKKTV